jgi:hypothetical protein
LAHGKEPPLPSQNSPERWSPLNNLVSFFFGVFLGAFLSKRRTPVGESIDTVDHQNSAERSRERRKYEPPSLLRVVVESLPPGTTPPQERQSEKKKDRRPQWATFWATLITFVAVAWYAMLTRDLITITKQHFRTDERAWMEIEPLKPIFLMAGDAQSGNSFSYELYPKKYRENGSAMRRNPSIERCRSGVDHDGGARGSN